MIRWLTRLLALVLSCLVVQACKQAWIWLKQFWKG
jgi:hypothetical protein